MFLVSRGDNWPSNLLSTENMQNLSLYLLKSSVNLVVPFENENGFSERYKTTHTDMGSSSVIRWSPCSLPCGGKRPAFTLLCIQPIIRPTVRNHSYLSFSQNLSVKFILTLSTILCIYM